MAVYYKWIKGCSEGSTLGSGLWSYIKWAGSSESAPSGTINDLPYLYVAAGKQDSYVGKTDEESKNKYINMGYFLTNKATDVKIEESWTFQKPIQLNYINTGEMGAYIGGANPNTAIQFVGAHGFGFFTLDSENNRIHHISIAGGVKPQVTVTNLYAQTGAKAEDLSIGGFPASEKGLGVEGKIESNNSVHAPYFNATSDMRAKENIKKLPFSALAFINNLNVYQFNYKDKNDTIPGVLAQDVLNCQPEGLSLVDNIDASGENGDYMSIKEDKFIFLLMRAVQELKEDNDALRYEIEQLKQKLK